MDLYIPTKVIEINKVYLLNSLPTTFIATFLDELKHVAITLLPKEIKVWQNKLQSSEHSNKHLKNEWETVYNNLVR